MSTAWFWENCIRRSIIIILEKALEYLEWEQVDLAKSWSQYLSHAWLWCHLASLFHEMCSFTAHWCSQMGLEFRDCIMAHPSLSHDTYFVLYSWELYLQVVVWFGSKCRLVISQGGKVIIEDVHDYILLQCQLKPFNNQHIPARFIPKLTFCLIGFAVWDRSCGMQHSAASTVSSTSFHLSRLPDPFGVIQVLSKMTFSSMSSVDFHEKLSKNASANI